jgi:predicted SAM-dependent methyltransferase
MTQPGEEPHALEPLYQGGFYSPARPSMDVLIEPVRHLMLRERDRSLQGIAPGASVFEVGAGDGSYISHLLREGYRASGVDPSPKSPAGALVARAAVDEVKLAPASQDVVMMWHVLEHLEQPALAVAAARKWLTPGGKLIVAVPNLSSLQARLGADRWFHQDVPRHRTHFTERGLLSLLEREGFAPVRVRHVLLEHNPLGMWQTLLNRLTTGLNVAFRLLKRDPSLRGPGIARDLLITLVAGPLLVPIAIALELAAGISGRGGTIVVEATPAERR